MTDSERTNNEFAIGVLLHEYDTLRAEILARTSSRFQLVGLAAVAATIVTANWGSGKHFREILWIAIISTTLAAIVIWVLFVFYINRCAGRLIQIEHEINSALGCSVLIWESYRIDFWQSVRRSQAQKNWDDSLARASAKHGALPWKRATTSK